MSSGGGGTTKSTVTQSNLPEYAKPYYQALMDRGLAESEQKYQPYTGQRDAGMSNATAAGLGMAGQFAGSGTGLLDKAGNINSSTADKALGMSNYTSSNITNSYNGPQQGLYQGSNIQSQQIGTGKFDSAAAQQYMSPYMDAVVGKAQQDAILKAQQEQAARGLQAAKAGSFGGSRAAVQQQMANDATQSRLTDIMVQGQQSAFENAQSQFNADQGRGLTAAQANQQAALDAAKANEASRQFGYGEGEKAYQTAAQLGLDAQKASEQFRQSGQELNYKGLDLANQSAKNMESIQQSKDNAMLDRIKAQLGIGNTVEDYQQKQLDTSYNDFVNQRDSEKQNLQFLSSLLQGVPISANSDVTQTDGGGQNNIAGALGSLGGLQALYALGR